MKQLVIPRKYWFLIGSILVLLGLLLLPVLFPEWFHPEEGRVRAEAVRFWNTPILKIGESEITPAFVTKLLVFVLLLSFSAKLTRYLL